MATLRRVGGPTVWPGDHVANQKYYGEDFCKITSIQVGNFKGS